MPNPELAARVRSAILTRPRHYDPSAWLGGTTLLQPGTPLVDTDPLCRTTLCVAGYAAHFTGHTLEVAGDPAGSHDSSATHTLAHKPGSQPLPVWIVAQRELRLTGNDAGRLFASCTKAGTVLAALAQLAGGAPRIHWDAIGQ
ncbi:hypothetical protein AB0B04_19000 [Streptomyces xinghaiensis]|uniref:Uncharacterized protein n=2 Tax=Streptomyces TaxID=1883 RepID=A0A420UXY3_9ACTN|nr:MULTISPECIES: hypothetical protein [Streptomyces]KNE83294.1 hypothetical protein ADZ36_05485 [Streptomyces fradiae]OFA36633.1 hypothetical protein BEN35_29695 [Streptomyces fradiae]PQM20631.1 hypothetical protein Sfr7A_25940 [Streptomyces xinghaiensis]RKM92572.1 hypothetical protein SFRA_024595 [Streptomyces xinghaiensis]RNC70540.1 hypothetical protein DC095_025585 [Streptomyces xinghaiensis]